MHFLKKNRATVVLLMTLLVIPGITRARTNCDDQAKPALDCPPGYTMSCIPVGGDHWGCSKGALEAAAPEAALYGSAAVDAAIPTQSDGIDDRFVPINGITPELAKQIQEAQKISITIDGTALRSEVTAGSITVQGWDPKEKKSTIDPEMIRTKENLEAYAQAVALSDVNILKLSIREQLITLKYQTYGKLFRFIPVRIVSSVEVLVAAPAADGTIVGSITMKFPWYHFLIQKNISSGVVAAEFAGQLQILNSVDDTQRIAQYLSIVSAILRSK